MKTERQDMRKKKVIVTGGTGYIGSHTVVELIGAGFDVVIADDLSNSNESVLKGIEAICGVTPAFEQIDITQEQALADFFVRHADSEAVIHFAAKKAVGESVAKPLLYYKNNLLSLLLLLERMQEHRIRNFIFSSSCTVYGQPDVLPVTESTPFKPAESPYGKTKQMGEEILRDVCQSDPRMQIIALRYFNPVGAHENGLIGELPQGTPSNLVPLLTQTAAGIRPRLHVFGGDYNTPDGTALRDFIHVADLARAHVTALQRLLAGKQKQNYEYFNVGTGKSLSVLQLINTFEHVNHVKINYTITARRPGDIEQIYADTRLANTELGWHAQFNEQHMLQSAWKWQQQLQNNIQP